MNTTETPLLHICAAADWAAAERREQLCPDSLATVGFVHLSTAEQVHLPANRLYAGRTDLLLLHIDPALLEAPVRWEPGLPTDRPAARFPHLYGPLPVVAVIAVTEYRPGDDGRFAPLRCGGS